MTADRSGRDPDPYPLADVVDELASAFGSAVRRNEPIGRLTTYRAGGRADVCVTVEGVEDLRLLSVLMRQGSVPFVVLGRGSNTLVADRGYRGVVIILGSGLATIEIEGTNVRAGGAAALPVVARRTVAAGLTGFEWAVGVPGSIGGAVRMNAGGHGSDMAASVGSVRVLDLVSGEDRVMDPDALRFALRSSAIGASQVVVEADLVLERGSMAAGEETLAEIVRWRRDHQPGGANAGSVFVNPNGDSAGRILDAAGARGRRVGSAEVSTKHANFIQVDEGGDADDVRRLMVELRALALAQAGVELRAETHLLGYDDAECAEVGARSIGYRPSRDRQP